MPRAGFNLKTPMFEVCKTAPILVLLVTVRGAYVFTCLIKKSLIKQIMQSMELHSRCLGCVRIWTDWWLQVRMENHQLPSTVTHDIKWSLAYVLLFHFLVWCWALLKYNLYVTEVKRFMNYASAERKRWRHLGLWSHFSCGVVLRTSTWNGTGMANVYCRGRQRWVEWWQQRSSPIKMLFDYYKTKQQAKVGITILKLHCHFQ